ncbi:MAG: glycerol-3-phosphate 1-O-acyltransferase PlsY [Coriobacteriia bacterium]|nr:glycerol-3-phosphate 1-O-acyltransferase PlsY [Coriobacteriia bacterium]
MVLGLIGTFVIGFLLGSIPWGVVIGKVFFHTDIRKSGSGNIGTTNAMRVIGKKGGVAVFVLDFGKGLLSGWIATLIGGACLAGETTGLEWVSMREFLALSFIGCISGHIYSPWLGFHGGKGIAVAVGCLFFVFGPVGACVELAIFIVLVVATRYVSVGSIAAAIACPFIALDYYWGDPFAWALITLSAFLVFYAHRENMKRLRAGNESRIGDKKKSAA